MAEKRTVRFVKWLIKVVISYAVFIGTGWLLGRIPAQKIGLSEDIFFDLRMFFMLFGPIYLSLERDLSRVFFTKTFAVIYEFIFFNFLIKDRQTSVNLNFHVIKENLKRSKLKLV